MPTAVRMKMLKAPAVWAEGRRSCADSFLRRVADRLAVTTRRLFLMVLKDLETFCRAAWFFGVAAAQEQPH